MANKKYPKRYHEYRGRRRGGSPVLKIVIGILVLALLACLIFFAFLGGKVEYTDDGVRIVLPWNEDKTGDDGPDDIPTPPVIIVEDPDETERGTAEQPEPSLQPESRPDVIGAVEVSQAQVLDGTAAGVVAAAGGNTLVVEMKTDAGTLYWNSAAADTAPVADDLTAAVEALAAESELYLVARVVCFRDPAMADAKIGGPLVTRGGVGWYDYYGLRWVSPASQEVRTYLTRLCLELAAMGFDEVLLECAGYPYFGETHVLATDDLRPEDLSAPVELFLQELKAALAAENVWMSLLVTEEIVTGTDTYSGITPELMARYADRVWVKAVEGVDYSTHAGASLVADRLVIVDGADAGGSWADVEWIARGK